jgi:hypothetical protein
MSRQWRRRTILISAIIVALSVGLVFASLPYLQPAEGPHASIVEESSHTVRSGTALRPGFYALEIQNVTISEPFYVGVSVADGKASFCVLEYQIYSAWATEYNQTQNPGSVFPSADCVLQTQQTSQETLKFSLTPGTWAVVALNTGQSDITVYFSPA